MSLKLTTFTALFLAATAIGFEYDEATQGDLPDWNEEPLNLGVAVVGENVVRGHMETGPVPPGDRFTFEVPDGLILDAIIPECDTAAEFSWSMWRGVQFPEPGCENELYLGTAYGLHNGTVPYCGTDQLPVFSEYCGNFTPPLGPGVYTFSGGGNVFEFPYTIKLVLRDPSIPAASEWGLVVMGLGALTAGTCIFRRRQALEP